MGSDSDSRTDSGAATPLQGFRQVWAPRIEAQLEALLPAATVAPQRLHEAMRYTMFPGGKRLRPILALIGCQVTGGDMERALPVAAGLEFLHTYSLVHDDLPCMDDDDLRRGRATCHKAYDEATAVLVGDGLLTLALESAAAGGGECVRTIARAAGSLGMVGGQAADLAAEGQGSGASLTKDEALGELEWIHDHKTGALIRASLEAGVHAGGGPGAATALPHIGAYGDAIGRLFQIVDDCLDLTAEAETLGKNPGQDLKAEKLTYPAVLGLEASQREARALAERASGLAQKICSWASGPSKLDEQILLLQDVATFMLARGC